jgi:putative tryptophan/tyrosine transport system substrate-binding protein
LGYIEGRNIRLELRTAHGDVGRLPAIAAELVRLNVNVILAGGGTASPVIARQATQTIPIVFPVSADPVAGGLVSSLARPGGNVTGLASLDSEVIAKRLQLLRELLPGIERIAIIGDPAMSLHVAQMKTGLDSVRAVGMKSHAFAPKRPEEFDSVFAAAKSAGADAALVLASSGFGVQAERLVRAAAKHRLVTVWEHRVFTDAGGLISYGADLVHMYRDAATYVDKILKGAKPGELPVQQASKFELVINLKTARELGLAIPAGMLVRAERIVGK